jgi:hypothetical protein
VYAGAVGLVSAISGCVHGSEHCLDDASDRAALMHCNTGILGVSAYASGCRCFQIGGRVAIDIAIVTAADSARNKW